MMGLADSGIDPLVVKWLQGSMAVISRWLRKNCVMIGANPPDQKRTTVFEYLGVYGKPTEMASLVGWWASGLP